MSTTHTPGRPVPICHLFHGCEYGVRRTCAPCQSGEAYYSGIQGPIKIPARPVRFAPTAWVKAYTSRRSNGMNAGVIWRVAVSAVAIAVTAQLAAQTRGAQATRDGA